MMEAAFFGMAFWSYIVSTFFYLIYFVFGKRGCGQIATFIITLGVLANTVALVNRTIIAAHAPFSNLYESLMFFSWLTVVVYLFLKWKYRLRIIGVLIGPIALLAIGYASVLPPHYKQINPLVPALQSHWLEFHVITSFLGYAFFATACGIAVIYLLKEYLGKREKKGFYQRLPGQQWLDEMNYKIIAFGFPIWTLGIVSGAIWANSAWGSYWSWDVKETWSLITWFVYAIFLHARLGANWRGKKAAYLSIIGFLTVGVTYIGVSLLLTGLHSYNV